MLNLTAGMRIYLAASPVDMRRSFDGLSAVILEVLQNDPLEGHLFVFRGKGGDKIKALYWDRNGLAIWYKRLEKGRFKWPSISARCLEMSSQELSLLLDGIDFTRLKRLPAVNAKTIL
jgi:transposase